ncbi:MAG: hypothetical protein A2079_01760, partial [Geobacteraceae bacterium GWC2_48_7]
HFLPGNGDSEGNPDHLGKFINKLICLPDSPIAKDMVKAAISDKHKPYGLHRLGIAMHVYADTWAHQQFAGVLHKVNNVDNAKESGKTNIFIDLPSFLEDVLDEAIPPLGHGRANVLPDMPFLTWQYTNGRGEKIVRNNTTDFCKAADMMCIAMKRYIAGNSEVEVDGIDAVNKDVIKRLFSSFKEKNGDKRHKLWLKEIRQGTFKVDGTPFTEELIYNDKGRNSWKAKALGTALELDEYEYNDAFLTSNWRMFHDALQQHRMSMLHDILPNYGICVA